MTKTKHQLEQLKEEEYSVKALCDYIKKEENKDIKYEPGENPPDYYLVKDNKRVAAIECRDIVSENIVNDKFESKFISKLAKELNDQSFIKEYKIQDKWFFFFIRFSNNYQHNDRDADYLIYQIKQWFTDVLKRGEDLILYLNENLCQDFVEQNLIYKLEVKLLRAKPRYKNISFAYGSGNLTSWIANNYRNNEISSFLIRKNLSLSGLSKYERILLIHLKGFFIEIEHVKNTLDGGPKEELLNIDKIYVISNSLERKIQLVYKKEKA